MKKVLITGINGFVGFHLVKELQKFDYSIFGLSRTGTSPLKNELVIIKGDISEKEELYKVISEVKPDAIFHLAALTKPFESFKKPEETFQVNLLGTLHILDIVEGLSKKGYPCKLLIAGSGEEYGVVTAKDLPVVEETPLHPNNPYSTSKAAGYFLATQYFKSYGLDIVYLSPFSHTGPGQKEGFLIPDVCKQIVEIERNGKEPVVRTGDLSAEKDYTDVRDVVRAYVQLLEKGESGERYNICSGKSIKVNSIVDSLVSMAKLPVKHVIDESKKRPSEVIVMRGSYEKLHSLTGWNPEISLDRTLSDCLADWRTRAS
jgi:GDP-4-dehydro-6-deoxy-D-mannose reductase